jgi:hypothetical protein
MISNVFHTHALVGAEKPARKGAWGLAHLAVCLSGWFLPLNHRLADGMGGVGGGGGKHADSEVYVCALVRLCKPSLGHQEQSLGEGQDSFARAWMWWALLLRHSSRVSWKNAGRSAHVDDARSGALAASLATYSRSLFLDKQSDVQSSIATGNV